ncbi:hypothetical protein QBZ16_001521 [Prototheca wickerhamii]|uniref:Uncharacterized protein n=1 Tax=Prototheca wickerhamii TaxID=3111 RepID=A0AAD9MIY2_PROWI|nr:hypothetical protein QBZ16_001521 [Prototheca wickerhamii]
MWQKDKEASDSMDPVCELMQLGWVMKTAIKVISKMQIEDTEESFAFTLKAGGVLDVKECFPRTGEQWDDPHAGTGTDLFVLSEDGDSLDQVSEMDVGGKHLRYVSRYKRIA